MFDIEHSNREGPCKRFLPHSHGRPDHVAPTTSTLAGDSCRVRGQCDQALLVRKELDDAIVRRNSVCHPAGAKPARLGSSCSLKA